MFVANATFYCYFFYYVLLYCYYITTRVLLRLDNLSTMLRLSDAARFSWAIHRYG